MSAIGKEFNKFNDLKFVSSRQPGIISAMISFATLVLINECKAPVPFLRNFHWGGQNRKKGRTKNMSRRGLANARV